MATSKKTLTNSQILSGHHALLEVGKMRLPRKLSYAVARNLRWLDKEAKFISEQGQEVAKRYARTDSNGELVLGGKDKNQIMFADIQSAQQYKKECEQLDGIEVEVDVYVVSADELDACYDEGSQYDIITPAQEAAISWMLDYGDEKQE